MTPDEIERELHQFILDSRTVVSIMIKKKELSIDDDDIDGEISRLIVEKIMERFFVSGPDGMRGMEAMTVLAITTWLRHINSNWPAYCDAGLDKTDDSDSECLALAKAIERGEWKPK